MHLCSQTDIFLLHGVARHQFRDEFLARIVTVGLHSEGGQRYKINAVSILDSCQIGVTQRQA